MYPSTLDSQPWFDGLANGRLLVQRCAACGRRRHYPRPMCPTCHAFEHDWPEISGNGLVHSWTITCQSPLAGYADAVPFHLLTVDMTEGVRMLGLLRDPDDVVLRIGLPVRASIEQVPSGEWAPVFRSEAGPSRDAIRCHVVTLGRSTDASSPS